MSVDYLRLLISDTEPDADGNYLFDDTQLRLFLDSTKNVYYAASYALRTIAANEVMLIKWVRTDDMQVDGTAVSKELRLLALDYENQGKSEENLAGSNYDIAMSYPPSSDWDVPEGAARWFR